MTEENKYSHIQLAINFSEIIRSTLGPRGMNKAVVSGDNAIFTNDGASIIQAIPSDPVINLFKGLAQSQENAIGDGTTTATILVGQFLSNALSLINKGIHPTTIINGYSLAKVHCMRALNEMKEEGNKDQIINTAFGSKVSPDIIEHLKSLILNVKDYNKLLVHKILDSDPLESKLFSGYIFDGFTISDTTPESFEGNIAFLDYRTSPEAADLNISDVDQLKKINDYDREYKLDIVNRLEEKKVGLLFFTDTNPEFETALVERGIIGVVVTRPDKDSILRTLNLTATSDIKNIYVEKGEVSYSKPNKIFVSGDTETLVLNGQTPEVLDEIERAVHDVVSLFRHETDTVIGAGAIEIELAKSVRDLAKKVGGKEQLAIEKYAESLESIPLILAENCGLDSIEILTLLKTLHNTDKNAGVDPVAGVSDARERGIMDPALVKVHAINSATNVANLILKTDKLLNGGEKE